MFPVPVGRPIIMIRTSRDMSVHADTIIENLITNHAIIHTCNHLCRFTAATRTAQTAVRGIPRRSLSIPEFWMGHPRHGPSIVS